MLTDSGGIQEEAPSFGTPVLVLREVTERPEGIEAGARLCRHGSPEHCWSFGATLQLLENSDAYGAMSKATNPFGDGHASERMLCFLDQHMRLPASAPVVIE